MIKKKQRETNDYYDVICCFITYDEWQYCNCHKHNYLDDGALHKKKLTWWYSIESAKITHVNFFVHYLAKCIALLIAVMLHCVKQTV